MVDGEVVAFYQSTSLVIKCNSLYVLNFDTVHRVAIEGAGTRYVETLAGLPMEDTNPEMVLGKGCDVVLGASELAALTMDDDGRLPLGDPKNSVMYEITK